MTRRLRHFYDDEATTLSADPALGPLVEPWLAHRERLAAELSSLTAEQWRVPSRCDAWTVRDVVVHLLDVDPFWVLSLTAGRAGEPTRVLAEFDPKATPLVLVDARASLSDQEVLDAFMANTETFVDTVKSFGDDDGDDDWDGQAESPMGHTTARLTLAHALWDSWYHERDILLPLGIEPPVVDDELNVVAWYSLFFGAAQGGLVDDPAPVGDGADQPFEVDVVFDDLPDRPMRVRVGRRVHLEPGSAPVAAGTALDFVEWFSGRAPRPSTGLDDLPDELLAHLDRARQLL
jgi:uncharacterized protein (TIGR03083 family)